MKRLLVIANLNHASPRIPGLLAYLPELGWEAAIVTPPLGVDAAERLGFPEGFLEKNEIVEAPYKGDVFWFWRKVFSLMRFNAKESITEQLKERAGVSGQKSLVDAAMRWYQTVFAYPDTERTWRRPALRAARGALESGRFDLILSSSPFPTVHLVAAELKGEFSLPWVADFRDTWTQNPVYQFNRLRKRLEEALERKTLLGADAFVTVSGPYAESLERLHKRKVHVIPNGFHFRETGPLTPTRGNKFAVTYTGTIYSGKQDPVKFLAALKNLLDSGSIDRKDIDVGFYGRIDNHLRAETARCGLSDVVRQHGTVSRKESIAKQRASDALLFFNWEDSVEAGLSFLKFYEYIAAKRPILACGGTGEDEIKSILDETGAGTYARTAGDIEAALSGLYKEFKRDGMTSYRGKSEAIEKYSYRERAKELVFVLSLAAGGGDGRKV